MSKIPGHLPLFIISYRSLLSCSVCQHNHHTSRNTVNKFLIIQMKVDRLTENLKEWKHVILLADRWLKWEQDEYPIILSASITIGFFLFWFLNPPVISAIAFAAMCICVADYVVPRMKDFGFSEVGNCSAEDEVRYKAICNYIVRFQYYVTEKYNWAKKQRELKPKRFFLAALICLLFIGFIAGAIPNLLLMYMIGE
ncbi:ADP-ribosylation factor-like protein 6-interacting protein 1 [Holothuria leucospilota]|uniref:ADP-ribosylation factor-like protein 6-interacting protein 1 n=1 Tax=Holothuria leucospilota TaxID=206669 RepID=A0A9Q1C2L2_HOLLE|nr:ADP-ribosylation factor-like protein 6-interacting protein 1 [Holothuria leucospilota]